MNIKQVARIFLIAVGRLFAGLGAVFIIVGPFFSAGSSEDAVFALLGACIGGGAASAYVAATGAVRSQSMVCLGIAMGTTLLLLFTNFNTVAHRFGQLAILIPAFVLAAHLAFFSLVGRFRFFKKASTALPANA